MSPARYSRAALLMCCLLLAPAAPGWDASMLREPVQIDDMVVPYPQFAVYRLPGTRLDIAAASPLTLAGADNTAGGNTAPVDHLVVPRQSGWYEYRLHNATTGEEMLLRVYALVPAAQVSAAGYLGDYRIGHYPEERLKDLAIYDPPAGFIRVTEADRNVRVSPNFTVGQFVSKQAGDYPKYLLLRSALFIKLERILRALNEAGHDIVSFHIMSGFRTPFYNKAIGNVPYSRHVWGGAADIFVDVNPRDDSMDDLNGDGLANKQDAIWLAGFIDKMSREGKFATMGGVGIYGSNAVHGPFVHVDVRGFRARW
jgi:hypothetical protein